MQQLGGRPPAARPTVQDSTVSPQRKSGTDVKSRPAPCLHSLPFRSLIKFHSPIRESPVLGIPGPQTSGDTGGFGTFAATSGPKIVITFALSAIRASCRRLSAQLLHIRAHLVQSVQSVAIDQASEASPPRSTSRREAPRYSREQTCWFPAGMLLVCFWYAAGMLLVCYWYAASSRHSGELPATFRPTVAYPSSSGPERSVGGNRPSF